MAVLDKHQVDQIHDLLVSYGVTYEALQIDLLDHICCMVEQKMDNDLNFDESLSLSIEKFGLSKLAEIQEATIYLLTIKLRKMKKTTGILGIIFSLFVIIGVLFKTLHLPGAAIMTIIGVAIVSILVLPLMAYSEITKTQGKTNRWTTFSGYFATILLGIGTLFKLNHWPFGTILVDLGAALFVFVFVPLFTIKNYKTDENKIFAIAKSLLIIAATFMFWAIIFLK